MRHDPLDIRAIDIRALSPALRAALKRSLIRRADAARAAAIRQACARMIGLLRPAMLKGSIDRVWRAYLRRRDRLQGLTRLSAMTDYELRDIGISRLDIMAAAWRDGEDPTLQHDPEKWARFSEKIMLIQKERQSARQLS